MKSTATVEEGTTTVGADDRAATTIQAVYRGFRARKYVETVTAAAVKIQAGFRGYRVRQSLKNAAPPSSTATATTTADNSQCWSDDEQKSVVSVTYAPLNEYGAEEPVAAAVAIDDEVFAYDGADTADSAGADTADSAGADTADSAGADTADSAGADTADSAGADTADSAGADKTESAGTAADRDDEDDVRALTDAAVKIQARVRGFAVRKHLNEEKMAADKE